MSTRATYEFKDQHDSFTIYKHCDGYPEGGLQWIAKALPHAWPLPRFEADEFAAAFVAANKADGGDVRITTGRQAHGDTEYHYVVTERDGKLFVQICDPDTGDISEEGTLDDLLDKHAPDREWVTA